MCDMKESITLKLKLSLCYEKNSIRQQLALPGSATDVYGFCSICLS